MHAQFMGLQELNWLRAPEGLCLCFMFRSHFGSSCTLIYFGVDDLIDRMATHNKAQFGTRVLRPGGR